MYNPQENQATAFYNQANNINYQGPPQQFYDTPPLPRGPPRYGQKYYGGGGGGGANKYGGGNSAYQQGHPYPERAKKPRHFVPATLKMVNQAQHSPSEQFEYDGQVLDNIVIVGRILQRSNDQLNITFEVNDNTGTASCVFYGKSEQQEPIALKGFNYKQFCYVKIYGQLRPQCHSASNIQRKIIVGSKIKCVSKFDELTNHFLQVFTASQIKKKGVLRQADFHARDETQQQQQQPERKAVDWTQMVKQIVHQLSEQAQTFTREDLLCRAGKGQNPDQVDWVLSKMVSEGDLQQLDEFRYKLIE